MGWNDHVDFDLHERIEWAVEEGLIEEGTPAYGIAQQVIHQGHGSLSEKQRWVWEKEVLPTLGELAEQEWVNQRMSGAPDRARRRLV